MKTALLTLALLSTAGFAQPTRQYTTPHAPLLGAAWYPEQWPESRWDADLALMEKAGMTVTRVGEFAWSAHGAQRNHYRPRLASPRHSPRRKASHRRRHRHPHRRPACMAHHQISRHPRHRRQRPTPRTRQPPPVLLLQPALSNVLRPHRHRTRTTLRPRPQRHRLADRQRVHRRVLRRRHPHAVPKLPPRQIQDSRITQPALGHSLLVADLRPLGRDSPQLRRQQPRPPARPPSLRHRNLAQLPARTDSPPSAHSAIHASSSPPTSAASAGQTTGTTTG